MSFDNIFDLTAGVFFFSLYYVGHVWFAFDVLFGRSWRHMHINMLVRLLIVRLLAG